MNTKSKKSLKTAFLKLSKVAVFCLFIGFIGVLGAIMAPKGVFSATAIWQDPGVTPQYFPLNMEPPINTSSSVQQKKGGLNVATQDGGLVAGSPNQNPLYKLYVEGSTLLSGDAGVNGNLSVSGTAGVAGLLTTGNATVTGNLTVDTGSGLFYVDSDVDKIFINTNSNAGKLNIGAGNESAIYAKNNSSLFAAIQASNISTGGTGIYGVGDKYGVWGVSLNGYGVLADASVSGIGGLYARGGNTRFGAVGRGKYGVVGLDSSENMNSPVILGPEGTLAGLFQGSVEIVPSAEGNADLTVDTNTFVVNSSNDRVGIGTNNPSVKLHTVGMDNQSAIYAKAGTNSTWQNYGGPTETVAGVYGQGGTITYNGAGTGWNFGVFGKAGNPGTGRSVGIMGVDFSGASDSYAGWFDGQVKVDGEMEVLGPVEVDGTMEIAGNIVGYGDLNLNGANSDINMTSVDSDITLTGDISAGGDVTYNGKLIMTGGLPALQGGTAAECNVAPAYYAEGTMFVCYYCPNLTTQRIHAVMARLNGRWVNIGYSKGALCGTGEEYIPEILVPSNP